MKNEFITTFTSLTDAEKAAFRQYIYYFHSTKKAELKTFEKAFAALSDTTSTDALLKFDYKNTHNDLHELKNWLIEFLTIQEVKSNSPEAQILTLEMLRKRKLKPLLVKKTKQLKEELDEHPSPDIWLTLMRLRLAHTEYFSTSNDKLKNFQPHLESLLNELDNFYISTKLKYSAELESRRNIRQENYNPRLLNDIVTLAKTDTSLHPNIQQLYLPLLQLIKDKSVVAFAELKHFLTHDKQHDSQEKLAILIYLLNFAAARLRSEPAIYYPEYYDLAQIGIAQDLFITAGYFPTGTFTNTVNAGCYLRELTWTEAFIETWSSRLNPDDAFIAETFALARVNFEDTKFPEAYDLLNSIIHSRDEKIHTRNAHFTLNISLLMARTHYELKMPFDVQLNHCKALEKSLIRNPTLSADLKSNIFDFIKILCALINEKKTKPQILKTLKAKGESVSFYEWLQQKIDKYKPNV
jgi:hypothetical protein